MTREVYTDTVYGGSRECQYCDHIMTPYEAMQSHDGFTCPTCRNAKIEKRVRQGMSEK